jgi:hypothetical protein
VTLWSLPLHTSGTAQIFQQNPHTFAILRMKRFDQRYILAEAIPAGWAEEATASGYKVVRQVSVK